MIKKGKIKNIEAYAFTSKMDFLDFIKNQKKILIAVNAEKVMINEPKLATIINDNIGFTDGIGVVMALKQKGIDAVKIPGVEFWLDIINEFYKEKSFYLLGSTEEVIVNTITKLKEQFKGINIIGYRNGYVDEAAIEEVKKILIEKKPDVVFVGQGSPRQEYLMDELIKIHPSIYMGLGGSFDIYCGLKQRAPAWFIKYNLEWFYRLSKEPNRFVRQFVLVKFFLLLKLRKL
jgi:UDP-N-acetyl-D-mannosaminouronate:lipid I N-acetyl-D-mannosaminouronosyltransferase